MIFYGVRLENNKKIFLEKEGTKQPKYRIIFKHESIQKAENKGKVARQLAAKISLAAKKRLFPKGFKKSLKP